MPKKYKTEYIVKLLNESNGNMSLVAKILKISRERVRQIVSQYGIELRTKAIAK